MTKGYHSKSYHRFYEGYKEEVIIKNGKPLIQHIYQGDYYCQDCTDKTRACLRICTTGLYLFSVLLYGYGATRRLACNTLRMAGAAQGLVLTALFWFLLPLYFYLTAKRKMTVRMYKDASKLLKTLSLGAAISFIGAALAVFIGWAWNPADSIWQVLRLCGAFVLGGASMLAIYIMEKNMKYLVSKE